MSRYCYEFEAVLFGVLLMVMTPASSQLLQSSANYRTVNYRAVKTYCALDALSSVSYVASYGQCAVVCMQLDNCTDFNFFPGRSTCQIFDHTPCLNGPSYSCTRYTV